MFIVLLKLVRGTSSTFAIPFNHSLTKQASGLYNGLRCEKSSIKRDGFPSKKKFLFLRHQILSHNIEVKRMNLCSDSQISWCIQDPFDSLNIPHVLNLESTGPVSGLVFMILLALSELCPFWLWGLTHRIKRFGWVSGFNLKAWLWFTFVCLLIYLFWSD